MKRLAMSGAVALLALTACNAHEQPQQQANASHRAGDEEIIVPQGAGQSGNAATAGAVTFPALNLAPDGVSLVLENGATRHATFGMPQETVLALASAALGDPIERGENQECGAGSLSFTAFRPGLALYFQGGSFVGWDQDSGESPRLTTAAGIGIGSTRRQLADAHAITTEDSSLGIEFASAGLSGLLSTREPDGVITHLWAGATCIAR